MVPGLLTTSAVSLRVKQKFKRLGTGGRRADALLKKSCLGPRRPAPGKALVSKFLSGRDFAPGEIQAPTALDLSLMEDLDSDAEAVEEEPQPKYREHEPLILREEENGEPAVEVPPLLCQWLRPHQREGVSFVFECVHGMKDYGGKGAILADDMGLGKTLQSITLMYALLKNKDKHGKPLAKRCIVVCPCSLVKNWEDEFEKWVNSKATEKSERVECMALSDTSWKTVEGMIDQFLSPACYYDVLVISYETFRAQYQRFERKKDSADIVICDEAHRLKNDEAQTSQALASLACRKRVLLSGTPMQNDLVEFFAMSNFTNPGVFGTKDKFIKYYEGPILRGREPDASDSTKKLGKSRQQELSALADQFIIRRMNRLNAEHLPPKLTQVVCCRLTETQQKMYAHVIRKRDRVAATQGHVKDTLGVIQRLQKICNHPSLATSVDASASRVQRDDARELEALMPENDWAASAPKGRGGRVDHRYARMVDPALSGKLKVLHALMSELRRKGRERIVVVSVYMTTLDLIEQMCNQEDWPSCKLGGSTSTKNRKKYNDEFNDPTANYFAFLLSSKAGGCGLNLIGGSRLVMFDLDWNPATDKQAAARCWRDGQRYQCYTYRFVSSGSLEERMLQRQLSKEGLQNVIDDRDQVNSFATDDLKKLFLFRPNTASDLHDELQCPVCTGKIAAKKDTSKRGGANILSVRAAARCLEVLEGSLLTDDAAAKLRLMTPISSASTAEDLHGLVDKKRWTASKPHADLGSVFAKLRPDAPGLYGTIPDVLKDLRRIQRTADKIFVDVPEHPTRLAAQKLVQQVDALWEGLVQELYDCNKESADPAAAVCSIIEAGGGFKAQQHPLPKEEDLNNWSHHASLETCGDEVLKKALKGRDDVSFVFGMYQDWDLIQQDTAAERLVLEERQRQREETARFKAEAALAEDGEDEPVAVVKKKKKKKKKKASDVSAASPEPASMDVDMVPVEKKKKKKKKKKPVEDVDMGVAEAAAEASAAAALVKAEPAAGAADAAMEKEATPPDAVITQTPAPDASVASESSATPDWPRPGAVVECVWTKGTALADGDVDRCVVNSIRDPAPHKKRKAGVPEHLAYHCYAELRSLIKLAGDTDQPYETVPEADPRAKHVHLKYKIDLADHERTWRVLPVSVGKPRKERESAGETFSAMSDLTNN